MSEGAERIDPSRTSKQCLDFTLGHALLEFPPGDLVTWNVWGGTALTKLFFEIGDSALQYPNDLFKPLHS